MKGEGYIELEALIQDNNVEDQFGTAAVMSLHSKGGLRGTE